MSGSIKVTSYNYFQDITIDKDLIGNMSILSKMLDIMDCHQK